MSGLHAMASGGDMWPVVAFAGDSCCAAASCMHAGPLAIEWHDMRHHLLLLALATLAVTANLCKAAFLEPFTTNPDMSDSNYNRVTPWLWVQHGQRGIIAGGRGPADPDNPKGANVMELSTTYGWVAETTLMNWLEGGDSTQTVPDAQLSFYYNLHKAPITCSKPVGSLKVLWSSDSMVWQPAWTSTLAQLLTEPGYQPVQVSLSDNVVVAPTAFKWVSKVSPESCESDFKMYLDDITFNSIPPLADTLDQYRASPAPLPSPVVCSALTVFCKDEEEVPVRASGSKSAGRGSGASCSKWALDAFTTCCTVLHAWLDMLCTIVWHVAVVELCAS